MTSDEIDKTQRQMYASMRPRPEPRNDWRIRKLDELDALLQ